MSDLPRAANATPATADNWLILAGWLAKGEYLSFDRKGLKFEDIQPALAAQYPGVLFGVGDHGSITYVFNGPYMCSGGIWAYGPKGWNAKS